MDVFTLKKVLPDINMTDPHILKITDSNISHESKVLNILTYHFNSKKKSIALHSLNGDAFYIKQLFPSLSSSYILKQLEMFKDMPNRIEIVLRIILSSKVYSSTVNPNVKRSTSIVQPADQSSNYYCSPVKIRKLTTGTTPAWKVIQTNNESQISKPPVTKKLVLLNPHTLGVKQSLEQQVDTLISNVQKVDATSTSPGSIKHEENDRDTRKSEDYPVAVPRVEMLGAQVIEEKLPVAEAFTISSSALEPKEDLEIINDYIREKMEQDQDKHSKCLLKEQSVEGSALPIARNCTATSSVNANNNTDQPKDWNLRIISPTVLHVYPRQRVDQLPLETLFESRDLSNSDSAHTVINDKFLPKSNGDEEQKIPSTALECDSQKGTSVVSSSSIRCVQKNQDLGHKTATNGNPQEESYGRQVNVPSTSQEQPDDMAAGRQVNVPSTSQEQPDDMAADSGNFNLEEYLYDITKAPLNVIQKQCRKLNLFTSTRPAPVLLQLIIDNLLANKISSESATDEDEPEMVKTVTKNELDQQLEHRLNKIIKLRSGLNFPNIPALRVQSKTTKPTASATITSQAQLDEEVFYEAQETAVHLKSKENVLAAESSPQSSVNIQLVTYLCGVFPDAAPDYIKGLCKNKPMSNEILDDLTTVILSTNGMYPKRPPVIVEPDLFPENQLDILKEFLPDADPDYLRMMCDKFEGKPEKVKSFINEAMEQKNYPTLKDYQRRQQLSAQQRQYTTEFSVENFIKLIPDPHAFFSDPQRTIKMDSLSSHYALVFLRNTFNKLALRTIQSTFTKNNCKLYNTVKELQYAMTQKHLILKGVRKPMVMPNSIQNIPLLQEIAYFSHEKEISKYLQEIKDKEEAERKEALSKGLLKTCSCCYDEEVLPKDIFCCEKQCSFCKFCIIKSTEVRFGEGKLDFPCLMNCSSHFSLQTLQAALSPKLFSKIAQKKALEEIKSAGIEELEMCPFCDFATIPAEGYNIFSCLNPECMKESCRLCKEPSHIPLRCEEIEKDEDVKARVFVENKMTEALLRKCWKCGIKFFKEEGCNKMTCSCGAKMCYICGSPVTDYKHFNGNGGDRFDLCPLYSDTNVLNKENVLRGAAEAKAEIGNKPLKHDPTSDVQQHYKERAAKVPQPYIPNVQNVNQRQRVEVAFLGVREAIDRLEQRYPQFPF